MHFHTLISHLRVPVADTVNLQLSKLSDEGIAEHLFGTASNSRMLDSIIDITDQADANRFNDLNWLSGRQIFGRKHSNMCRDESHRRTNIKVARFICHHVARFALFVVEKENSDRHPGHGVGEERT